MNEVLSEVVESVLERARAAGAAEADAVVVSGDSLEARVRGEETEHVKQASERRLGLRVFAKGENGFRSAITSTSDLAADSVERMAAETVALARATAEDPTAGLPEEPAASDWPDLDLFDPADRDADVEDAIDAARRAERALRETDPRITNSEGSDAGSHFGRVAYGSTRGFRGEYEAASHSLSSAPIASEDGQMQTDHWVSLARQRSDLLAPSEVGRIAAERALSQLGARRVATCEVPVIFDPTTSRSLLSHLAACVSGYSVYRGGSFLKERLGETIATSELRVTDDGRRPRGLGSRPFDGEGLPTRRTVVVEEGRLASWLLDSYSGRKLGMASTGNATRSAGSPPAVGPTNLWIEPGDAGDLEALVAGTDRGLLVTGLFGHGFNAVTGDLSRGARGFWIENGERVHPVEEITVAGNLGDVLMQIDAVGSDLLWLGRIAAPSLRVARMTVAGA